MIATQKLSDRINRLSESATIAMSRKSREMKEAGHDIINLSLGEPDFGTPQMIREAAKKAIDEGYTHYPPVNGYGDLREAIARKFERDNGLSYDPDQIVVSTGAKQSIANIVLSLVNPGDEVLLPAPFWVTYHEIIKLAEGVPVVIPTTVDNDFKVTPEQVADNITERTRLLLFSTPCNPSGSVYSQEELKDLADLLARHEDIFVISDEIYELINFTSEHQSIAQFDNIRDRTAIVNGVSKGFAMTGWRIGYMAGPEWLAKACTKLQGQFTSGASSISQMAAKAAISADPTSLTSNMRQAFLERRDGMIERLSAIEGLKVNRPEGAFFIFPDASAFFGKKAGDKIIENATDLAMHILEEGHVSVVTGEAFGDPNCIRLSYAASEEELQKATDRIKQVLEGLS